MNEKMICYECGRDLDSEESHPFDDRILCEECYLARTVCCDCCGDRVWREESEGDGSIVLCLHCWETRYSTCEDCGALIPNDDAFYDNSNDCYYCRTCFSKRRHVAIKPYNYKPEPLFYGEGDLYLGVELEIDRGGENNDNAERILSVGNHSAEHVYAKHDGSLCEGFEIVSHPMTLAYHQNKMNWDAVFREALSLEYASHNTETCGLHVHVNRDAFGTESEEQEACVGRLVFFVEKHWNELVRFSRRKPFNINRWAARYATISPTTQETYKKAKDKYAGRYVAVNLTNYETVEFRLFRGTLRYPTFLATLQLVAHICNIARETTDESLEAMSWGDFVLTIDREAMPELIEYLRSKRLYVNEPVEAREEA